MPLNLEHRLQSLRMVAGLAKFLQHPDDLTSVFAVVQSLEGSPLTTQMVNHLLANQALATLIAEQWRPAPIDLDALESLPEGSLGQIYARQLKDQGLTPESLLDPNPIRSDTDYITHRLRETHDIVHVLTGFGTDPVGEIGLQAFNLAQNRSPMAALLWGPVKQSSAG